MAVQGVHRSACTLALIAGVLVIVRPGAGLLALVRIVGTYLVVGGVLQLASAFSDARPWLRALLGLRDVMLGILIFAILDVSVVTFALLFGIGLVATARSRSSRHSACGACASPRRPAGARPRPRARPARSRRGGLKPSGAGG